MEPGASADGTVPAAGCPVLYLKRLSMGPIRLDPALKPGEYRPLTEEEVELLKKR